MCRFTSCRCFAGLRLLRRTAYSPSSKCFFPGGRGIKRRNAAVTEPGITRTSKQHGVTLTFECRRLSSRRRIFDPALQVPAVLSGVVLDVGGGVGDPAAGVVYPVRPHRVAPHEVPVQPRGARQDRHAQAARGEDHHGGHEHYEDGRHPYRARQEDDGAEEDEGHHGAGEGEAGEQQENGAGDDEGEEADDLRGVGCLLLKPADEAGPAGGAGRPLWPCRRRYAWASLPLRHSACWRSSGTNERHRRIIY